MGTDHKIWDPSLRRANLDGLLRDRCDGVESGHAEKIHGNGCSGGGVGVARIDEC
jgi:hypothetical protein